MSSTNLFCRMPACERSWKMKVSLLSRRTSEVRRFAVRRRRWCERSRVCPTVAMTFSTHIMNAAASTHVSSPMTCWGSSRSMS